MTQMTDAPAPPPEAPEPPAAPPLVRLHQDRVWLGVCAAIGRSTGTDPVLWRVVVAVLTLFGGSGLLLYGAGWALIRGEGEPEAPADRVLRGRAGRLTPSTVVLAVLLVLAGLALVGGLGWGWGGGPDLVPVAVVALLAYLVLKRRHEPYAPVLAAEGEAVVAPRPTGPPVTLITLSGALLVGGALVGLAAAGVDGITAPRVSAAVLAVFGVGLVIGSRYGRQLGLVSLALLSFGALNVTACLDIPFDASAGERTWVVTGPTDTYRLGAGEAVLDLSQLSTTTDLDVRARLGAGQLEVVLPPGLRVEVHGEVGIGVIDLPGEDDAADGGDLELDRAYGPVGGPVVRVDTRVGLGNLVVSGG